MDRSVSQTRRKRVALPLTPREFTALQLYAARKQLPLSRVLLSCSWSAITEILAGRDPLPNGADPAGETGGAVPENPASRAG